MTDENNNKFEDKVNNITLQCFEVLEDLIRKGIIDESPSMQGAIYQKLISVHSASLLSVGGHVGVPDNVLHEMIKGAVAYGIEMAPHVRFKKILNKSN